MPAKYTTSGKPKQIGNLHRQINRMIIDAALRPLHPVNNASSIGIRMLHLAAP